MQGLDQVMIDVWQYYEYVLDSKYARVLDMLWLHVVLKKFSIKDILQGSEYALGWICQCYTGFLQKTDCEYVKVTHGSV